MNTLEPMIVPVLVNRHHKIPFDVYIGRGSIWGNDHPISVDVPRELSIALYREDLIKKIEDGIITIEDFRKLSGNTLGCSCSPKACHGDVIIEFFKLLMEIDDE